MIKIRPLNDRLVVKRKPAEDKTTGGLYIPENAKERPLEAEVISVGNGKVLEDGTQRALCVKVGDTVLYGKYAGTEFQIDDQSHLILREDDVLAVLEK